MRIVLDASAAAHIILRTDLAPALIEKPGQGRLVIAPSVLRRYGCRLLTVDKRLITLAGQVDESMLP